jgi:hypothetical protein
MELYYFISIADKKEGPYTLEKVKTMNLSPDTIVWRSDDSEWRSVHYYDELSDSIYIEPPKTPKEIQSKIYSNKFLQFIRGWTIFYFIYSFFIALIAKDLTQKSWNNFLEKLDNSGISYEQYSSSESSDKVVNLFDVVSFNRYPVFMPGVDLENVNAIQQSDLFRVYKPFYATNYITRMERIENSLFSNMLASSIISNFIIFVSIAIIVYFFYKVNT